MKILVLSLTRDRLKYTKHCFKSLRTNAGCIYDHLVLDQGSTDGTREWLFKQEHIKVTFLNDNIGIARGLNKLLDSVNTIEYDVIVHFDNDCELTQPNTLRDLAQIVYESNCILSPRILGLNNPPSHTRELMHGDEIILDVPQIGGICLTAPAWVYDDFRYPETLPVFGGDDEYICGWFRIKHRGTCGYVKRLEAWHYEGTDGQHVRYPDYFDRRVLEGGPV